MYAICKASLNFMEKFQTVSCKYNPNNVAANFLLATEKESFFD
jgi:hypothetical protein